MLTTARLAPSGANLQPGYLDVLTGKPLKDLSDYLVSLARAKVPAVCEYSYFPDPMPAHFKARQRAAGYALYAALGVERRDLAGRAAQFERNYRFFEAPVGVVVSVEASLGAGCYMDLGIMLQTLMLAAQDLGLASCGIGALANYGAQIRDHLCLPADRIVVAGLALGYADPDHPANETRTARIALDDFVRFHSET